MKFSVIYACPITPQSRHEVNRSNNSHTTNWFFLRKLSDFFISYISMAISSIFRGKLEMNCVMHIIATTVHITMCIKLHKLYFESYRA